MNRDKRIDTLRGLLLAIMTIDHLGGYLTRFTDQSLGYLSAAEGFVFLSGFVCMEAYGSNHENFDKSVSKIFRRSFIIYKYHVVLTLLLPTIAFFIPYYISYWQDYLSPYYSRPIMTTLFGLVLLHKPMYMDILPMYCIFLTLSPLVFILINNGKTLLLILISISLWASGQLINPVAIMTKIIHEQLNPGYFNIFSWQLIFILGIVASHHQKTFFKIIKNPWITVLLSLFALIFWEVRHAGAPISSILLSKRADLPLHTLINFILVAALIAIIISKFKRTDYLPFFEYLGKNSLQVFSSQIVLIYLWLPFGSRIYADYGQICHSMLVMTIVMALAIPAYVHNKCHKHKPPTRKAPAWKFSPRPARIIPPRISPSTPGRQSSHSARCR